MVSGASAPRIPAPVRPATYERTGNVADEALQWVAGTGNRALHDQVVAAMPVTPFIVGGSIVDDAIRIRTAPAGECRSPGMVIRFDDVVAPGGVRLNGAGMEHHLLTAKVLVNTGLIPGIGWCSSETSMKAFFRSFTLLVRWMGANGLARMDSLRAEHFDLFHRQLTKGGLEGLFPVLPSLEAFLAEVSAGRQTFPFYEDRRRRRLSMDLLAQRFGLARARNLSAAATSRIRDVAAEVCPDVLDRAWQRNIPGLGSRTRVEGSLTVQRVAEILEPWQRLHETRARLSHDPISYRAFTPLKSREQVSVAVGRETARTRDIPYDALGFLLDRAIRWLDYAEHVRVLYEAARSTRAIPGFVGWEPAHQRRTVRAALACAMVGAPSGPGAPYPMLPEYATFWGDTRGVRQEGLDLRTVLTRLLPGACFLLIATFSARRKKELESLRPGCVVREGGDPWLMAWIGKNMREVDRIPVPESVARAIAVLEWLSEDARKVTGEDWLFSFQELTSGKQVIEIDVVKAVNEFARFVRLTDFCDGVELELAPHQFRRAFALIYFYRFRMPSLPALSFHLRHYNSEMTRIYLTDNAFGSYMRIIEEQDASEEVMKAAKRAKSDAAANAAALEEVAEDFLVEILTLAERGEEPMVGKGGEALKLDLGHYMAAAPKLVMVSGSGEDEGDRGLDKVIRRFAKGTRARVVPNPSGTSYCLCGSDPQRLALANCLRRKREREGTDRVAGATGPDFAYAEPSECGDCYNGVQLPENNRRMVEFVAGQKAILGVGTASLMHGAAAGRARKVDAQRVGFYGPAEGDAE